MDPRDSLRGEPLSVQLFSVDEIANQRDTASSKSVSRLTTKQGLAVRAVSVFVLSSEPHPDTA
jgi:hypothetical protein